MTFADDAGEYSVFAKNPLGEVSASASLLEEGGFPSLMRLPSERRLLTPTDTGLLSSQRNTKLT